MKTFKRIVLIVFSILLVIIVALGIWQRDNIKSFVNFLKYSEEEISQKIDDNNKKMDDIVETTEYIDVKKGGFTPEEEKALTSGEISEEEAIKIMRGQTSLEEIKTQNQEKDESKPALEKMPDKKSEQAPPESKPVEEPEEKNMTDEASNIVAELYVVKANFISQLENTGQQMYNEYIATHYDPTKIMSIVDKYLPVVSQLEAECDATINNLLSELKTALENGGGDLSLINEIRQYYYKEKSLKKSYYMNLIYANSK